MSISSLTSAISLGIQSGKGVAATAYKTALATASGANARFDERQPKLEHPSAVTRATKVKSAPQRTGYTVPVEASFLLRPRFIGTVLRGAGFAVSSASGSGFYTHTFTLSARNALAFLTAIKYDGESGNSLERKITDVRISKLSINAGLEEVACELTGLGLAAGAAAGNETKVAEIPVEISPYSGSATVTINGSGYTAPLRGNQFDLENTLKEDDKILFSAVRADLAQTGWGATGKLQNVDFDYNTFQAYTSIVNAGGGSPSLTAATGALSWIYNSLSNIPGASVPYSFQVTMPSVAYKLSDFKASNDELIRCDIEYTMIDDTSTPITIVLKNDQASY